MYFSHWSFYSSNIKYAFPFSDALSAVAKRLEGDAVSGMGEEKLTCVAFRYLSKFHESIVNIDSARTLVQCLVALTEFPCFEDLNAELGR